MKSIIGYPKIKGVYNRGYYVLAIPNVFSKSFPWYNVLPTELVDMSDGLRRLLWITSMVAPHPNLEEDLY